MTGSWSNGSIRRTKRPRAACIIPDSAKEKPQEGEVVAVGKGKRLEDGKVVPLGCAGRRPHPVRQVFGQRDQARRRRILIMREDEVLGILEQRQAAKAKA